MILLGRLWYRFTNDMRLETHGCMYIRNTLLKVSDLQIDLCYIHLLYINVLHVLVYLMCLYSFINSLSQVSHHLITCTLSHWLVVRNVTYEGRLSWENCPNNNIHLSKYCDAQQRMHRVLRGILDVFLITRNIFQWNI